MIKLVNDTVDKADIDQLILWLQGNPRLTKVPVTLEKALNFIKSNPET